MIAEESVVGEVRFGGREDGGERDDGVHHGAMRRNKQSDRLLVRGIERTIIGHEVIASTCEGEKERRTR